MLKEKIVRKLEDGATQKQAAAAAGIAPKTLYAWRDQDDGFDERVIRARHQVDEQIMTTIADAARNGDVSAAQWWANRIIQPNADPDYDQIRPLVEAIHDVAHDMLEAETAHELLSRVRDVVADE